MEGQEKQDANALVRQWMKLVNEFIDKMCRHAEFDAHLPDDYAHKLRVMLEITQLMPSASHVNVTLGYRYHCNNCGNDFETFARVASVDGSHEVCPKCGFGRWKVTDTFTMTEA